MYGTATIQQIKAAKASIASELKLRVKTVYPDKVYTPTEIGKNINEQLKGEVQHGI
jgi:hypothetical protein